MDDFVHHSVMQKEVLDALDVQTSGWYVDATFGRGGHSSALLNRLSEQGRLFVMDRDPAAFEAADPEFLSDPRVSFYSGSFDHLGSWLSEKDALGRITGILFDLGVSSPQLDDETRGFSFMRSGPLDMRMDPRVGEPLSARLEKINAVQLAEIIKTYGEERYAKKIAQAIVTAIKQKRIGTTGELAEVVKAAHPAWPVGHHPATRTFQALRIWVNDEEGQLKSALNQLQRVLAPKGRVVILSFHSLEDGWAKTWGISMQDDPRYPKGLPVPASELKPPFRVLVRLQRPTAAEIDTNPRSRSARLRAWEKSG